MFLTLIGAASAGVSLSAQPIPDKPLQPLALLVGKWTAIPGGADSGSAGAVQFSYDAGGSVLVGRARNGLTGPWTEMMVVYAEGNGGGVRAESFEPGRPPIHYRLAAAETDMVQFVGEAGDYRLTYRKSAGSRLEYVLESARPDRPGSFRVEASGTLAQTALVRPLAQPGPR